MKILNLYFSATGNTKKVAEMIERTALKERHDVETVRATATLEIDFLKYDLIIMGSGVYHWLPAKPFMTLINKAAERYRASGDMPLNAKRRSDIKGVTYCTYGGAHTGINEAYPATAWMGQFFDHLGIEVLGAWHIVGEYHGISKSMSTGGRLGDVRNRPNEKDLEEVSQMVKAVLLCTG
ncbi:flavodoxin domain-containing protein [Lentisphaerota bacterium ZTH]|nr:flavodoxin [Lentisphaerota bacterium]WET06833.1 flavodoxin domain-containing protein [Lentisphaerota bacterium ZTH]